MADLTGTILNIQKFSIQDGPGIRTTVFFAGCPLCCRWCSNPESQNRNREAAQKTDDEKMKGRQWTVEEVLFEVRKDRDFYEESHGGMTLSGGEVLQQHTFAIELLKAAHAEGIHCAAETTGYAPFEIFAAFAEHVDLLLFDMKHFDSASHLEQTGVPNEPIIRNLRYAVQKRVPVIARIPVIPRFNFSFDAARGMAALLGDIEIETVNLLPFHQFGEKKYEQLGLDYKMAGVKQLHREQLGAYQKVFLDAGLKCSIC